MGRLTARAGSTPARTVAARENGSAGHSDAGNVRVQPRRTHARLVRAVHLVGEGDPYRQAGGTQQYRPISGWTWRCAAADAVRGCAYLARRQSPRARRPDVDGGIAGVTSTVPGSPPRRARVHAAEQPQGTWRN